MILALADQEKSLRNVMESRISLSGLKRSTQRIFSRSSGPGGQNVNKTASKVMLIFSILDSTLSEFQKLRLLSRYPTGEIQVMNQETRSQHQNTFLAYEVLRQKIEQALIIPKKRKKIIPFYKTKKGKVEKAQKARWLEYKRRKLSP